MQLIYRDFYILKNRILTYVINYCIIFPLVTILGFGYIQSGVFFKSPYAQASLILMIGSFVFTTTSMCFSFISPFIYDVEGNRFIDYQLTLLPAPLLVLEIIVFAALFALITALPFFPLVRIIFPQLFSGLQNSWVALLLVLFFMCLCIASYIMLAMCLIKSSFQIRQFFVRVNLPLVILGGSWLPWYMMKQYWAPLAYIVLLNPFTYITEGIRASLFGNNSSIPWYLCILALATFTFIFTIASCHFFKRKLDPV